MTDDIQKHRRAAFLAGTGTLTMAEVNDWGMEIDPGPMLEAPAVEWAPTEKLMVALVSTLPNDMTGSYA